MSFTIAVFCPGCGEKNVDTDPTCTKCGLDLARLRVVIAEGDLDTTGTGGEKTLPDAAILPKKNTTTGNNIENCNGDIAAEAGGETTAFDNSDPIQLKERGNELFRQEKFMDALDCYEKALAIDQFYQEAWFNKSIVLKKIGRQDQSKVCWGIYKRLSSGVPEAQKNKQG
jgi:tetratricopeptide (TPR) repeat protein